MRNVVTITTPNGATLSIRVKDGEDPRVVREHWLALVGRLRAEKARSE